MQHMGVAWMVVGTTGTRRPMDNTAGAIYKAASPPEPSRSDEREEAPMDVRMLAAVATLTLAVGSVPAGAADGEAVWKARCAKCHGETGAADTAAAKAMQAPVLKGNAKIAGMSTADIVAAIKASKKHAGLKLPDADLEAAAGHAKELAAKQ
jgi:mono/diheme cytochrome c family protein